VSTATEPATTAPPPARGESRWVRPFVAVAVVVGLLLLGAAGGLLLGLPGSSRPEPSPVDIGFSQDMSVHHLQAVEMAGWERDHTGDPVLAQLATDIEKTQNNQVGQMQGWLALWDAPALPVGGYMAWMSGSVAHDGMDMGGASGPVATMPGMATSADLDALRAADGPALDVLFLQLMLRHHEGGAEMLSHAAQYAAVPQVRNLAAQMLSSQASEAEYLRQLLTARGGTPLPR
jgi:uncharacterized protein (DUF305 family)